MAKSLNESLSYFKHTISDLIKSGKNISIISHLDCDGLTSASIIGKALFREGIRCTISTTNEFNNNLVDRLSNDSRDFHIITDLAGGFANTLDEKLGEDWLVLDHHEIPEEEYDNERVINSWKFGIDGGLEICAGGMTYLASKSLNKKNEDLAAIAIISAIGDRQDKGERKSFTGKNLDILNTAKSNGQIDVDLDLLLVGRETRPLSDALAFTSQPFIEGLTWNRSSCLALLNSSGIPLKEKGRWRVPAELSDDEKRHLIETISKFATGKNMTEILEELIGYTFTFPKEDQRSFLRDVREFSTVLNSCGRISKSGVGISICMGDRHRMLQEGEKILSEYRKKIRDYMNVLSNERWRTAENMNCVMVNGEGVVPEMMTGTITSIIAGAPKNTGKIVILRTNGEEGMIKFSSRKSNTCNLNINLSSLMRTGAAKFDGVGGGHDAAAGAKITKDKLDDFLDYLEGNVTNLQDPNNTQ